MNLSLYKLKKKLKSNKQAQGSLIAIVLGGVVLSTIVASGTSWYLTMRNNLGDTEDKLEAQTIAMSEWERLSHMSLDELEAKRSELSEKYSAGSDSQYQISVNLGEQGTFNNGTCGAIGSDGYANCFKNTTITVYRDGNRMFTTRTLPLMAGDYTRKEIDDKLATLTTKINNNSNAITNLTNRLNGKEFIKNRTPNYDLNLRYEKKAGENSFSLHAYNGDTEIPLASAGGGDFYYKAHFTYESYSDGSSRTSTTDFVTLSLCMKTKSGEYIYLAPITKNAGTWYSGGNNINFDGHTISWTGEVGSSYSALYIDGQYVGILRGEYYFKM